MAGRMSHVVSNAMRNASMPRCHPAWLRCGVCIGYEKEQDRYIVRLIMAGVETDVALRFTYRLYGTGTWGHVHRRWKCAWFRDQNFSVLKPKLRGSLVQLKGSRAYESYIVLQIGFTCSDMFFSVRLQSKPELNGVGLRDIPELTPIEAKPCCICLCILRPLWLCR